MAVHRAGTLDRLAGEGRNAQAPVAVRRSDEGAVGDLPANVGGCRDAILHVQRVS